jgi:hypothetical protein
VLSMCALALLAVAAARSAPRGSYALPADGDRQPAVWRDTGKLPTAAGDRPPPMTPA